MVEMIMSRVSGHLRVCMWGGGLLLILLLWSSFSYGEEETAESNEKSSESEPSHQRKEEFKLPDGLKWETNNDDPIFADPRAQKGGFYKGVLRDFPATFRQVGPNSNSGFRRLLNDNDMGLLEIHPNTGKFIPSLATHWAVAPDHKTVYYKLDPRAQWSDGKPVTAEDYLFTLEFMRSPHIVAPWYNKFYTEEITEVIKHNKNVISVVLGQGVSVFYLPLDIHYQRWYNPSMDISTESISLKNVSVRCVTHPNEKRRWDELMKTHHYLPYHGLVGRSLRHVAEYEGEWLALIGWQGGAFKIGPRDRWIGWCPDYQYQRLHLIAQNARFLVLRRIPNLASRVLTLSLSRLPRDMEKLYGHTVLLAETFVNPSKFKGSCYRACGWQSVGLTKGFSRIRNPNSGVTTWKKNHNPKEILMKCIVQDAREQLSADQIPDKGELHLPRKEISSSKLMSLHQFFGNYQDHRSEQGKRYPASCFFTLICAANLCNYRGAAQVYEFGENLSQENLKTIGARLCPKEQRYRPPAVGTIHNFMQDYNPEEFQTHLNKFSQQYSENDKAISLDGKTQRTASKRSEAEGMGKIMNVAALEHGTGVVLDQQKVAEGTNEIITVRQILEKMDINERVITLDAMHAQHETAELIIAQGGDYVFTAIKNNQKSILSKLEKMKMKDAIFKLVTEDNSHGRIEKREYYFFDLTKGRNSRITQMCGRNLAIKIVRTRTEKKSEKTTVNTTYALTSLSLEDKGVAEIAGFIRNHWGIENSLHYLKDTAFKEDANKSYKKNAPQLISQMNNIGACCIIQLFQANRKIPMFFYPYNHLRVFCAKISFRNPTVTSYKT